ncbi:MAG TPA: hypothetical protein VFX70_21585 [Mycobacteriales bacterium]|nr:hypothetical protein [Mycobacteriales bacterium]
MITLPPRPHRTLRRLARRAGSTRLSTRSLALLGAALLTVGLLPATSQAETTSTQTQFLAKIGPLDPQTGYPTYFEDSNGLRLSHCFDGSALCGGAESPLPDPSKPPSFPDNFPAESPYFLAQSVINLPDGSRAVLVATVEASFGSEVGAGERAIINRVRMRITTPDLGHYTVTSPYGVDEFDVTAIEDRNINFTNDIGIAANNFDGVVNGRVDPFLTWDTGLISAPDGHEYVGDPGTPHAVTGSPFGTNVFRIDGPDIGGVGVNTIQTNLFALVGRVDTNSGVDPGHPTYSRSTTDGGFVDVQASTDPGKSIKAALPGDSVTTLRGGTDGSYVARLPFTGSVPPTSVMVENLSDNPVAVFHSNVTDMVTITDATYDSDAQTLSVTAASSDQAIPPPLTVTGFGALEPGTQTLAPAIPDSAVGAGSTGSAAGGAGTVARVATPALTGTVTVGTQTFTGVAAPPENITVTSAVGGSSTSRVLDIGTAFLSDPVTADAGPDQTVQQGQGVTLDGSASINAIALAWVQTSGTPVTLTGADTAVATFVAPAVTGTLGFQLIARSSTGSSTDDIVITVQAVTTPTADAGPDQVGVLVGNSVLLDASGSIGASTFAWTQVSGAPATLTGADTARASFLVPVTSTPLVFQVTVSGPGGSATDQVSVSVTLDVLPAPLSRAEFRSDQAQWRIAGTASILNNNIVTVFLGNSTSGTVIGSGQVNPLDGTWEVRVRDSNVSPAGFSTVTVQSSKGGLLVGQPFTLKN